MISGMVTSQDGLVHNETFYFPDGNICLSAGNVVFRVLKSQLARESAVFEDLFSIGDTSARI